LIRVQAEKESGSEGLGNSDKRDEICDKIGEAKDASEQKIESINENEPGSIDEAGLQLDGNGAEVCRHIAKNLKPHQEDGIKFMWKSCVFENNGCILAHSMGLGKTIQVVALIHAFTTQQLATDQSAKCIVLAPCTLVTNWRDEFAKWILPSVNFHCYVLTTATKISTRVKLLNEWNESKTASCLIASYETFCNLAELKDQPEAANPASILFDGPDLAIFDEGHRLKNDKARVGKILSKLKTKRYVLRCFLPVIYSTIKARMKTRHDSEELTFFKKF
jgi:SNF2 family DNA or RNA helicase